MEHGDEAWLGVVVRKPREHRADIDLVPSALGIVANRDLFRSGACGCRVMTHPTSILYKCHTQHAVATPLILLTHIGVDRAIGYGLKDPTGFKDTHLQRV